MDKNIEEMQKLSEWAVERYNIVLEARMNHMILEKERK